MEMDIGTRLREARESRGLSLEEVQDTTKIQKRYLQAIEANEFNVLPGKFYTRAFIREYASAVGLDPEVVMEDHKQELPKFEEEEMAKYSRVQTSKQRATKTKTDNGRSKLLPSILTAVLLILIVFVVYMFTQDGTGDGGNEPTGDVNSQDEINAPVEENMSSDDEESTTEDAEEADTSKDESTTEEEPEEPAAPEVTVELVEEGTGGFPVHTYRVMGMEERTATIELTGEAYLQVQAPEGSEGLIAPIVYGVEDSPITLEFPNSDQLYIKTGSAPNTIVKINGETVPFPNPELSTQKLLINFE